MAGHSEPLPIVCCKTYAISVKDAIKHTKKLVLRQENAYEFGAKESLPLYLRCRKGVKGSCEKTLPFVQGGLSIESESFHPDQEEEAEAIPRRMFNEI